MTDTTERTLDWRPQHDPRSRNYPVMLEPTEPRSYTWRCDAYLDQGQEGACVGFSIAHEIAARPKVHPVTEDVAHQLYNTARQIDEWPGEDYEGTSVLAGVKAAQQAGYYTGYRWAFTLNEALAGISRQGPAVIGVWWHEGMWEPDAKGFIHRSGQRVGGHAILVNGVSVPKRAVRVHNSWGRDWGHNGEALLSWDDFAALLMDDGECCFPIRR